MQDHVNPLLSDASGEVKRALLCHVTSLCTFFGRLKANDVVLSHLVTYLNTRDWQLRRAFNEYSIDVTNCVGSQSLEEYILPLITLSLAGTSSLPQSCTRLTYDYRRGGNCRRSSFGISHDPRPTSIIDPNEDLGPRCANRWIPLSSQHLDSRRSAAHSSVRFSSADASRWQVLLHSWRRFQICYRRPIDGAACIRRSSDPFVPISRRLPNSLCSIMLASRLVHLSPLSLWIGVAG